jgi:hypothetical protein
MARHIDIELTSRSDDGWWTWRAAGARQPKGLLDPALAPPEAAPGAVFRAEVESGLDGFEVVALSAPKSASSEPRGDRIEVLGTPRRGPDVSVTLAPGARRRRDGDERPGRREGGERRGSGPAGRPARRTGPGPRSRDEAGPPSEEAGSGGSARRDERRPASRNGRDGRDSREGPDRRGAGPPAARRDRRPTVSTAHRNAVLAGLRPEQLPVAEQLVRGGIPAVRQAIEEQNARAKAEGRPPVAAEPLLAMAEELRPAVNLATWKDRASSAQAAGRELRLRELRAVVTSARTVNLDEEGRAMAKALQESLDQRVTALREEWLARLTNALDAGRVLDALRTVNRPPEPGTRCPADLAVRLAQAAGEAMTAETPPAEWLDLLEAVVASPVRRTVRPAGIPADEQAQAAARGQAGLVPELAKLLGLRIPPPPPRRVAPRRPPVSEAVGGGPAAGR